MTQDQVDAIVAELIAEKNAGPSPLACKFAPYLADHMDLRQEVNENDYAAIKANCSTFIEAAHAEAISRLRDELATDPMQVGYAGKKVEEIQSLLMAQKEIYVEQTAALLPEEFVALGVALANDFPYRPMPSKVQALIAVRPPRIGTIWSGIPYCRNLPSLDNINEALK